MMHTNNHLLFIMGYFGCGKTTQSILFCEKHGFHSVGGAHGADSIGGIPEAMADIEKNLATGHVVIHSVIYQTNTNLLRFAHNFPHFSIIVLKTHINVVRERIIGRGAKQFNEQKYEMVNRYINKLPLMAKELKFGLYYVDNNLPVEDVQNQIEAIWTKLTSLDTVLQE